MKILVVDDSRMARRTLRRMLESVGHEVLEAQDGVAALEHYSLERPDVVLLDMIMPGMSGLETLTALRELDARARVVMATADIQDSSRELALQAGAHGFVTKPFVHDQVLALVAAALKEGRHGLD